MQPENNDVLNKKIRVGAVNYLNTKPLIYGFEKGEMKGEVDLILDYPSRIASMLKNDEIDVGLVPVSIIPELKKYYIISDYCIGSDGEVASVALFSEVPLQKIEKILLDYQSRTSIDLLKILIKEHWNISPQFISTSEDYREDIKGSTAGLIIGDRALKQIKISRYKYDLGGEWKKFTGLPFVFAAWVSNKKMDQSFIEAFNKANVTGLRQLDKVANDTHYSLFDLKKYYREYISYELTDNKKKGLHLFLKMIAKL